MINFTIEDFKIIDDFIIDKCIAKMLEKNIFDLKKLKNAYAFRYQNNCDDTNLLLFWLSECIYEMKLQFAYPQPGMEFESYE